MTTMSVSQAPSFDRREGARVRRFGESFIVQTKGRWAGKPIVHEPWQKQLLDELYLRKPNGDRVYSQALIGVARKNGKSTLSAELALYGLIGTREHSPEVYAAAASRDQARIVFNQAKDFVEASPRLMDYLTPQRNVILCKRNRGVFRVLASDAPLQYGLNPNMVVIDELWAHANPELYYALTTADLARENPLVVAITTAGFDRSSICFELYQRGMELRQNGGIEAMRREGFLFWWYEVPAELDYTDPENWHLANPSSWITPERLEQYRRRFPESVFRRLHLNQWCLTPDTLVSLADGGLVRAGALRPGDRLIAFDENRRKLRSAKVELVVDNGVHPVYEVTTRRGRRIRVTAEHRFWCHPGRWVKATDLAETGRVAVARGWEPEGVTDWLNAREAWFLGAMTGDGGCTEGAQFTNDDPGVIGAMASFAESVGLTLRPRGDHPAQYRLTCGKVGGRNAAIDLLRKHGLFGKTSHAKRVPEGVLCGGPQAWLAFLAGYLDTDGCVSIQKCYTSVVWVSVANDLLRDCQHLLALLGVQSTVREATEKARGRLEVHEVAGVAFLTERLPLAHALKAEKLRGVDASTRRSGPQAADRFDCDRVKSVRLLDPEPTMGITVAGLHTHVTAGLITHNTETEDAWIKPHEWDACVGEPQFDPAAPTWMSVDVGVRRDSAGITWGQWHGEKLHVGHKILRPEVEGPTFGVADVRGEVAVQAKLMRVLREVSFDPWQFLESAEILQERGVPMVEFPQTGARMAPASMTLWELVTQHRMVHDGNPVLREQVLAAVAAPTDRGEWRISKRKSQERIDAAISLAMTADRAVTMRHAKPPRRGVQFM